MAVLAEIAAITYDWAVDPEVGRMMIETPHPMLDIFLEKAKRVNRAGTQIDIPVKRRRLPGGTFEYYDELSTVAVPQWEVATTRMRNHFVTISISSQELLETVRMDADMLLKRRNLDDLGAERAQVIIDLLAEKVASAPNDLRQELADSLWTGSGSDVKAIDSLYNIIYNNTASYGGVAANGFGTDAGGNNFWASIVNGTAGNTDPYTFANVKTDRAQITRGRKPRTGSFYTIMSPDDFGGMEMALQGQQRFEAKSTAAELGFETIAYRNMVFMEDPDFGDNYTADVAYVNCDAIQMYIDSIWDFKITEWVKSFDNEAINARMYFRGQVVCKDRRHNGWRTGITL